MRKAIDRLNDLIRLDLDAIGAYTVAIEGCGRGDIKVAFQAFRRDHQRHVRDLGDRVVKLGGEPARHRDIKGIFILGFTMLASRSDHGALRAMRGNLELTNRVYESVLDEEFDADTQKLVMRNYGDEQRHLAWIKDALLRRIWEHEAQGPARATGTPDASPRSKRRPSSRRGKPSSEARRPRRPRA